MKTSRFVELLMVSVCVLGAPTQAQADPSRWLTLLKRITPPALRSSSVMRGFCHFQSPSPLTYTALKSLNLTRSILSHAGRSPLVVQVPKYTHPVANAAASLTPSEKVALFQYTDEGYTINSLLRSKEAETSPESVQLIDSAIKKLPPCPRGTVLLRGESTWPGMKDYVEGAVLQSLAYTSSSSTLRYPGKIQIKLVNCHSARDISAYSKHTQETEFLFPRGTKFKVLKVENSRDTLNVTLEELSEI